MSPNANLTAIDHTHPHGSEPRRCKNLHVPWLHVPQTRADLQKAVVESASGPDVPRTHQKILQLLFIFVFVSEVFCFPVNVSKGLCLILQPWTIKRQEALRLLRGQSLKFVSKPLGHHHQRIPRVGNRIEERKEKLRLDILDENRKIFSRSTFQILFVHRCNHIHWIVQI